MPNWVGYARGIGAIAAYRSTTTYDGNTYYANTLLHSYDQEVQRDGPRMYWKLDEAGSATTAADSSNFGGPAVRLVGDYDDTAHGTTTGPLVGLASTPLAADFSGENDYVTVDDSSSLYDLGISYPFTMEAWFKRDSTGVGNNNFALTIHGPLGTETTYFSIGTIDTGEARAKAGTSAVDYPTDFMNAGGDFHDDEWHHIVAVFSNVTISIYMDGKYGATQSHSQTGPRSDYLIQAGRNDAGGSGNGFFKGGLANVAVYNTALTSRQIRDHYIAGRRPLDLLVESPSSEVLLKTYRQGPRYWWGDRYVSGINMTGVTNEWLPIKTEHAGMIHDAMTEGGMAVLAGVTRNWPDPANTNGFIVYDDRYPYESSIPWEYDSGGCRLYVDTSNDFVWEYDPGGDSGTTDITLTSSRSVPHNTWTMLAATKSDDDGRGHAGVTLNHHMEHDERQSSPTNSISDDVHSALAKFGHKCSDASLIGSQDNWVGDLGPLVIFGGDVNAEELSRLARMIRGSDWSMRRRAATTRPRRWYQLVTGNRP